MLTYRTLPLGLLLAAACGDDTVTTSFGTGDATTSTTADPTTSTTSPNTTSPSTTSPNTTSPTTGDTTSDTTGDPDTTSTSTTGSSSSSGTATSDSTGAPVGCGVPGEIVDATLEHTGQPAPCGPLEFNGQRVGDPKGPTWTLDGCPCGADCFQPDPWSFQLTIPAMWEPMLPECPRIVVDRQMGFGGCEFVAVSIWDGMQPEVPAFFHAGAGFAATTAAQKELTLAAVPVEECACDFCCNPAQLWSLDLDLLGQKANLLEGQTLALSKHQAVNFESHSLGICDAPLAVHWAVRALP